MKVKLILQCNKNRGQRLNSKLSTIFVGTRTEKPRACIFMSQKTFTQRLVRYSEANNIPVVIGCDSNSHHVSWGSTDTNRRGAALLEYIANSYLEVVNRESEPTFVTQVTEQVIDITLSLASIWQEIVNWRVSKE
jgi:ribosomal protein L18